LAANITAGHSILVIISGLGFKLLTAGGLSTAISIFPIVILILVIVLEIGVALIQAYVFSVLTAIYINESIHLH
jgi:F0F1-type ATP synthase membrane subunit a